MQSLNSNLFQYALRIGDTSLILSHRLSEWCGHGPMLEEDIALSNMALDLIGQARIILSYAAKVENLGRDEDALAYHRDCREFRNLLIAEQPNVDFAVTMVRQYFISIYHLHLFTELKKSTDPDIAAFADKSLKEVIYHARHSYDWIKRLGGGTEESHQKVQDAVNDLWYFTTDIFEADEVDEELLKLGIAADMNIVKDNWNKSVDELLIKSTLSKPTVNNASRMGSRNGNHTEHLGYILAEMQFLPRAYPDAKW